MIAGLVSASIRFRGVVLALATLVLVYGVYVIFHARYDVYPEFAPPQITVQTEAPGLSPEQVELLVTRPLENVLNGVNDLTALRSQSVQGLSVVAVVFQDGTDIYQARQLVSERLAEAGAEMPAGVSPPMMSPMTSATGLVLIAGLTSQQRTPMELRTYADWTLRPHLLAVPGVARVTIFGGAVKQLQVQVTPRRLAEFGVSLNDVIDAAGAASGVRGGGFVETAAERVVLQPDGAAAHAEDLGNTVLGVFGGRSVRLKDVATVVEADAPKFGDAQIDGDPGVLLLVSAQYGANTLDVTQRVEDALAEMNPSLDAANITLNPDLFRPADFIRTSLGNMGRSLLFGALLVAVVLFLTLYNVRTGLISITAIPLSLVTAIIVLHQLGASLNTLSLGGLAIAIGEVVDDAIIDVENIYRRFREADPEQRASGLFRIVFDASMEVRGAVVYATFIVALVFLPVLTMSGVQGSLFSSLAIAYILAILASLLVALTVTPALTYVLLPRAVTSPRLPRYVDFLKRVYERMLRALMARPALPIVAAGLLIATAAATLPYLGAEFLPSFRENDFVLHMAMLPGTSMEESLRMGRQVTASLTANPSVASVTQQVGRAEQFDDTWGPEYSEFYVSLNPLNRQGAESVEESIVDSMRGFPGASFSLKTVLAERMEEVISGSGAEVVIHVFGDDLDTLDRTAAEVLDVVSGVPGAADVRIESPQGAPRVAIRLNREKLVQFGFQPVMLLDAIWTGFQGRVVGQVYQANRVFDVSVILPPEARTDPAAVGSFLVENAEGTRVPLRQLADVFEVPGRYSIGHDQGRRRQNVLCNVRGRDLASFVAEAERALATRVELPAGTYTSFAGTWEARNEAQSQLFLYSSVVGVGILVLLAVVFRSWRNSLLVLVNLPFALVGGVLAAAMTGGSLSVGSLVGFVTLFGITVRNSVMMISHFEHLVTFEGESWGVHAAIRGAGERVMPVMMTALTTALGLLPLALGSGEAGREIEGPMAIIILGGLITSTVLNLLVLPPLAVRFARFQPQS